MGTIHAKKPTIGGWVIKILREERGLSYRDFSSMGFTHTAIYNAVNRGTSVSVDDVLIICRELNADHNEYIRRAEEKYYAN